MQDLMIEYLIIKSSFWENIYLYNTVLEVKSCVFCVSSSLAQRFKPAPDFVECQKAACAAEGRALAATAGLAFERRSGNAC